MCKKKSSILFAPGCKIYIYERMGTYLGQNFLIDTKIRSYIADKISALYRELSCEVLIEIGPGKGSISKLIDTISPHFFMIDKDSTFIENGQLSISHGEFVLSDVLDLDVEKLLKEKGLCSEKTLVVGNLPYYITSPILRKFFDGEMHFAGGIFMVQDEVGQKIKSDAKKKSYLRWLINYGCTVTYLKGVPAKSFKPAPKVKSCLIQIKVNPEQLDIEWSKFVEFLELFAPYSRKTLGAIQTMLTKRFAIKTPLKVGIRDKQPSADKKMHFIIPASLQKKRLEELSWDDLMVILAHKF